jgi:hypothetical protein
MMTIRRLTPDEQEERQADRYEELYAQIEANMREEYDRLFGAGYRSKNPYKPNSDRIHAAVMAQMQRET